MKRWIMALCAAGMIAIPFAGAGESGPVGSPDAAGITVLPDSVARTLPRTIVRNRDAMPNYRPDSKNTYPILIVKPNSRVDYSIRRIPGDAVRDSAETNR